MAKKAGPTAVPTVSVYLWVRVSVSGSICVSVSPGCVCVWHPHALAANKHIKMACSWSKDFCPESRQPAWKSFNLQHEQTRSSKEKRGKSRGKAVESHEGLEENSRKIPSEKQTTRVESLGLTIWSEFSFNGLPAEKMARLYGGEGSENCGKCYKKQVQTHR